MKKILCCTFLAVFSTLSLCTPDVGINNQQLDLVQTSEEEIKKTVLQIFHEAQELFKYAEVHFDKFLTGSHKADSLTFKDFVWAFKGFCEGMDHRVIRPLEKLHSSVDAESSLGKALAIMQSIATELHQVVGQLCKSLHPYERTKNRADAGKVAKLFKTNVEKFLTKDRFNKYLKNLQEVIDLLTTKSNFNELTEGLVELKKGLDKIGNKTTQIDNIKVLNCIANRIGHN